MRSRRGWREGDDERVGRGWKQADSKTTTTMEQQQGRGRGQRAWLTLCSCTTLRFPPVYADCRLSTVDCRLSTIHYPLSTTDAVCVCCRRRGADDAHPPRGSPPFPAPTTTR